MKKNNKGFTLAELLIVVAVIAVLVAVAIPTFSSQLEKSRQAVDVANLRGAYAAARVAEMDGYYMNGTTQTSLKTESEALKLYYNPDTGELQASPPTNAKHLARALDKEIVADTSQLPDKVYYGKIAITVAWSGTAKGKGTATITPASTGVTAFGASVKGEPYTVWFGGDGKLIAVGILATTVANAVNVTESNA